MASEACCSAGAPLKHDYTRQGTTTNLADGTPLYLKSNGPRTLLLVHDIFGFDCNQVFQVADRLSEQGFSVAVPDLFQDNAWPLSKFPPPDQGAFMAWIQSAGDVNAVSRKMKMVKEHMQKEHGATQFGVVGFCWGGGVSLNLAGDASSFKGAACCHPAFFGKEKTFAAAAETPVCFLPAKGDPMEDAKAELDKKPFADQCVYRRFDDQEHGFMAARGDWSDAKVAAAAGEGIELLGGFFDKLMTKT